MPLARVISLQLYINYMMLVDEVIVQQYIFKAKYKFGIRFVY